MKKYLRDFNILFIYIFLTEIICRFILKSSMLSYSLLRILFSSIIISMVISLLINRLNKKITNIIIIFISLVFTIYSFFEIGFYYVLGNFSSLSSKSQLTKVLDYVIDFLRIYRWYYFLIFVPFIMLVIFLIIEKKKKINISYDKLSLCNKFAIISLIFCAINVFYCFVCVTYFQSKYQVNSNRKLFNSTEFANQTVNTYGVIMFGFIDLKAYYLPNIKFVKEIDVKKEETNEEIIVKTDYSRNIDDTIYNEIINNETNENYNEITRYIVNSEITDKNEYTGLFEDKNLIMIMLESVNDLVLNEEYFPNIYKLYSEGYAFVNNFSPRNACPTGNNELSSLTSLYTINNVCTYNTYKNNKFYYSLINLFNEKGYNTSSFHNYTEAYYYRTIMQKNLGSNIYYGVQDLDIRYNVLYKEWPSDNDLMEKATDILLKDDDKFMAFMVTVTTHQPYAVSSEYGDKYLDLFDDLDVSLSMKRYLSKVKELDYGIETLLGKLEEAGKLDDTVIVMFGDHYPYGLETAQIQKLIEYDVTLNKNIERTPFIIYNSSLEGKKIEKYSSYIDFLPTLANLFNLNYDPRFYMGKDLFDNSSENLVAFTDGSWQSELGFYDSSRSIMHYNDENITYSEEEILNINKIILDKIKISNRIIELDYYKYLKEKIDEYKIEVEPVAKNEEKSENIFN